MKLDQLLDLEIFNDLVSRKYISVRHHQTLPLRIFNYSPLCQVENYWPYEVCQCRGLIVGEDDEVIARPFLKFFNLGQRALIPLGTRYRRTEVVDQSLLLDQARHGEMFVTEKMDGQLGILWNYQSHWGIATRGSFASDGAKWATEKWQKFVRYEATEFVPQGWTLLFEVIARHLRIVVPYDYEGLVLIGAVNNITGEEANYARLAEIHAAINTYAKDRPWCRLVKPVDGNLATLQERAEKDKNGEGWVVTVLRRALPPIKAKVKIEEYKRIHRMVFGTTAQMIWEEIGDPLKPLLRHEAGEGLAPAEFRNWVLDWDKKLHVEFHRLLTEVILMATTAKILSMPPVPLAEGDINSALKKENPLLGPIAFNLWKGNVSEAYHSLWKIVRPIGREDPRYPRAVFAEEGQGENADSLEPAA